MKYEEFKTKVEEINLNLHQQLEQKQNALNLFQTETIQKLLENKNNQKEVLVNLETYFNNNEEEKNKYISSLKSVIIHFREELEKEVKLFKQNNDANIEKERLFSIKEDQLSDIKQARKKETQELNQKISTLDRECIITLKAKGLEYEEEEKNYRSKLADLEKKMRFEVQKISDSLLAPKVKSDLETEPQENNQDYTNTNEIKEIRRQGIQEIAKIKNKYFEDVKASDLAFNLYNCNFTKDNAILREEYNLQIEELKHIKKGVQEELQKAIDMYDFETYKKVNLADQKYRLEANQIVDRVHQKIYNYQTEILKSETTKNQLKEVDTVNIYNKVKEIDFNQVNGILGFLNNNTDFLDDAYKYLNDCFRKTMEIYQNLCINLINDFWDNFNKFERKFYESLIFLSYSTHCFNGFNYDVYYQEIDNLSKRFNKGQALKQEAFLKQMNTNYEKLLEQIDDIYFEAVNFKNQQVSDYNAYTQELQKIIVQAQKGGYEFSRNYYLELQIQNDQRNKLENDAKNNEVNQLTLDNQNINDDFDLKTNELIQKITNYKKRMQANKKNEENLYKDAVKNINNNINSIKEKYKKELKATQTEIINKYRNEVKEVEKERLTKIKIGQI
jgi:hypothetical protein